MDHPLIDNVSDLSDEQLDENIVKLTKKYFQTRNPQARQQLQTVLDMYKLEKRDRFIKNRMNPGNSDLDKLINSNEENMFDLFHLTEKGNILVAEEIVKGLQK